MFSRHSDGTPTFVDCLCQSRLFGVRWPGIAFNWLWTVPLGCFVRPIIEVHWFRSQRSQSDARPSHSKEKPQKRCLQKPPYRASLIRLSDEPIYLRRLVFRNTPEKFDPIRQDNNHPKRYRSIDAEVITWAREPLAKQRLHSRQFEQAFGFFE